MPRSNRGPHTQRATRPKKTVQGVLQLTRKAVGYVAWPLDEARGKPDKEKEDIEIRPEHLRGALDGDVVEVELVGLFPRPKGKVVKVVSRAREEFVATIKGATAVPDDIKFYQPIKLKGAVNFAEGEKVLVKLISFDEKSGPLGEVLEHIGKAGEHRVEMNAIVLEHGFRTQFPPEATREAQEIEKNHAQVIEQESKVRTDFRGTTTFTIDPADAKDFDDALSVVELPDGTYEIGVHIADVTHYVREGSAIEEEVLKRGTSVYLVDATIPMLPHELSSNICSLRQDEDRLAFSAVFRMDKDARVLERKFQKTIIRSNKRFSYQEAQEVLETGKGPYLNELAILRQLARVMRKRREEAGAIDFGDNEVKFVLDESGKPLSVERKVRIETMLTIEEFMLLCNQEVATYVSELAKKVPEKNLVFLYRIHDEPKADRIEELATFVRAIGYDFAHKRKPNARDIRKLLKEIEGKPEQHLIRTATLRSMAKAIYTTKNIGHFGLSFEYYTHFTSPIRRYPDMLAHRILASHLSGKPISRREFTNLEQLCISASQQEARAVDAERESIKYKQVEFMAGKVGQTFDGVISGVTDWGVYVEEKESAAEGLVRVRSIGDDFYNYVQKDYSLVGQRTKQKLTLGDRVKIKLVGADLAARTLDFELVR